MKRTLYIVRLGMTNLPGLGSHPGLIPLIYMVALGALAGAMTGSALRAFVGAVLMLLGFGTLYLVGAYERGVEHLERSK